MSDLGVFGKGFALQAFTAAFIVVYASLVAWMMSYIRTRKRRRDTELLGAISSGLTNGQVEDVDDLVNLYRGIVNGPDDEVAYKVRISRALRKILVVLAADKNSATTEVELRTKIKSLLAKLEQDAPFSGVPTAERNLIIDAQEFVDKAEPNAAKQKINDLAGMIEARQEAYDRLQSANRWAVPLAVIGLVLTIVFGVISLAK